ncbi:MAG: DUF5985 family protein [Actinomycetota bacterium]
MAEIVYLLCAVTSVVCAVLLLRSYFGGGTRLLLWSGLCFAALAVNNILLFVDLVVIGPDVSLIAWRDLSGFVGVALLVYGLVWETK